MGESEMGAWLTMENGCENFLQFWEGLGDSMICGRQTREGMGAVFLDFEAGLIARDAIQFLLSSTRLRPREVEVLSRRWLDGEETFAEISESWGCVRERARQVELAAFRKLRNASSLSSF